MTDFSDGERRGADLILAHCDALDGLDGERPPAAVRLERKLGGELARLLMRALVGDQRGRSRRRR